MTNKKRPRLNKRQKEKLKAILLMEGEFAAEKARDMNTFAIIDAAKDSSIPHYLAGLKAEYSCLLQGKEATRLASVAPYLVCLQSSSGSVDWYLEKLYGYGVGFALQSSSSLQALTAYWSDKVRTTIPGTKEKGFFRFYDPQVLRKYLALLTEDDEIGSFMATSQCFVVESDSPEQLELYDKCTEQDNEVLHKRLDLDSETEEKVA